MSFFEMALWPSETTIEIEFGIQIIYLLYYGTSTYLTSTKTPKVRRFTRLEFESLPPYITFLFLQHFDFGASFIDNPLATNISSLAIIRNPLSNSVLLLTAAFTTAR